MFQGIATGKKVPQCLLESLFLCVLKKNFMGYRIPMCFYFVDPGSRIKMKFVVFPSRADEESEGNSLSLWSFCGWFRTRISLGQANPDSIIRRSFPSGQKADCVCMLFKACLISTLLLSYFTAICPALIYLRGCASRKYDYYK